jgi:sugar transferase (PEP-CTERM/EpsH1 system associated)
MDILILSHLVPYPATSGVLLRCYNLLREVARQHRVHLYALNQGVLLEPGEHLRAGICEEVRVFSIPTDGSQLRYGALLARNLLSSEPYSLARFRSAQLQAAVAERIASGTVEVVQFETIAMAPYGEQAPGIPQVLVHQNVESTLLERRARSEWNPLIRGYIAHQARKLRDHEGRYLRSLEAHVAVSEADRKAFLELEPGARVEVVENGVDLEYFQPGARPEGADPELVFVGGMSWYPNREGMGWFLDEVWPRILEERPDARLRMIGSHPSRRASSAATADPERVHVMGLVPDIRPYVREAAIFICPLRVGGGTRLKILDAWAMGKAVLSTTVGCEGLEAESGRELWVADDSEDFARAALRLLRDAELRRKIGRAGRQRAERDFAWSRVARTLLRIYEDLT